MHNNIQPAQHIALSAADLYFIGAGRHIGLPNSSVEWVETVNYSNKVMLSRT